MQAAIQAQLRASPVFAEMWRAVHLSRTFTVELRAASAEEIMAFSGGRNAQGWTDCKSEGRQKICVALFLRDASGKGGMAAVLDRATHELIHAAGFAYNNTEPAGAAGIPGGCYSHSGSQLNTPFWGNSGCGDILKAIADQMDADRDRAREEKKKSEKTP